MRLRKYLYDFSHHNTYRGFLLHYYCYWRLQQHFLPAFLHRSLSSLHFLDGRLSLHLPAGVTSALSGFSAIAFYMGGVFYIYTMLQNLAFFSYTMNTCSSNMDLYLGLIYIYTTHCILYRLYNINIGHYILGFYNSLWIYSSLILLFSIPYIYTWDLCTYIFEQH